MIIFADHLKTNNWHQEKTLPVKYPMLVSASIKNVFSNFFEAFVPLGLTISLPAVFFLNTGCERSRRSLGKPEIQHHQIYEG